jgi:lysophospholipase L1-like esterase
MDPVTLALARKQSAEYLYPQIYAVKNKLKMQTDPVVIALQGDSTGDGTNEWFYLFGQWLASKYPAYTVKHAAWSNTLQCYNTPTEIAIGVNGRGYLALTNANTDHPKMADATPLHITEDIDLRIYCNADDWSGAANQCLIDKLGVGDERAFSFYLSTAGKPVFYWSPTGAAAALKSAVSTAAISADNGTDLWIRCTVDVDNGSSGYTVKFYTSTDGVTWFQLGSNVTAAGVTALHSNTQVVYFGYGSLGKFYGKIYYAEIRNGIDGAVVASPDFGMALPMFTTAANLTLVDMQGNAVSREGFLGGITWANGSPVLLLLNGSVAGAKLSDSADVTRFALQHASEADINFISYGHNESGTLDYRTEYLAYCTQLATKWPSMGIIPIAQNPEIAPASGIVYHKRRCQQILQLAASRKYLCIDVYNKMLDSGHLADYILDDGSGIHPNAAGSAFWRDCITWLFN